MQTVIRLPIGTYSSSMEMTDYTGLWILMYMLSKVLQELLQLIFLRKLPTDYYNSSTDKTITLPTDGRLVKWAFNDGDANTATTYYFEMKKT